MIGFVDKVFVVCREVFLEFLIFLFYCFIFYVHLVIDEIGVDKLIQRLISNGVVDFWVVEDALIFAQNEDLIV